MEPGSVRVVVVDGVVGGGTDFLSCDTTSVGTLKGGREKY